MKADERRQSNEMRKGKGLVERAGGGARAGLVAVSLALLAACAPSLRYTTLKLEAIRKGENMRRYLVIHGNEQTAKATLREHLTKTPGTGYIVKTKTRTFRLEQLEVDPNRAFSRVGAEANLRRLNPGAPAWRIERALARMDRERGKLVAALTPPEGGLLIALHNNQGGYSMETEIPISDAVSVKRPEEPHEFFLCTDPRDFAILERSPYNAVLQRNAPPDDDGSLSRLAAARGWRYINLEVGLGKQDKQREMLKWAERNLPAVYEAPR